LNYSGIFWLFRSSTLKRSHRTRNAHDGGRQRCKCKRRFAATRRVQSVVDTKVPTPATSSMHRCDIAQTSSRRYERAPQRGSLASTRVRFVRAIITSARGVRGRCRGLRNTLRT